MMKSSLSFNLSSLFESLIKFISAACIGVGAGLCSPNSVAQVAKYAAVINDPQNYGWYVPDQSFLAYLSNSDSFLQSVPVGDQTLWVGMQADPVTGAFTGTATASFALGPIISPPASQTMQGTVDALGNVRILFTPVEGGSNTFGVGKFQEYGNSYQMEMQMISGSSLYTSHWAYMVPYPASFTPSQPVPVTSSTASPQWRWTAGTAWQIVSPTLFGDLQPGRVAIVSYNGGYLLGQGVDASGNERFTALGSITPEGKVLFNTISGDSNTLDSFYGDIVGNATQAAMSLGPYTNPTELAYLGLITPYDQRLIGHPSAKEAAAALYRIAGSPEGLDNQWLPLLTHMEGLSDSVFSGAVSQTLPVLSGAGSMATSQLQTSFSQLMRERQDVLSGRAPAGSFAGTQKVWGKAFGNWNSQGDLNEVAGYKTDTGGLAFGFDHELSAQASLGLSIGYARSSVRSNSAAAPSSLNMDSYQAAIYGTYQPATQWELSYQIGGAINSNQSSRNLSAFDGFAGVGPNANGQYNSYAGCAGVGLRKQLALGANTSITPTFRIDYLTVQSDAYTESGGGNLSLNVSSQSYNTLYSSVSLRINHQLSDGLTVFGNLGAGYNALDTQAKLTSAFVGGGSAFQTTGLSVSPWMFDAGLGLGGAVNENLQLSLRYDTSFSASSFVGQMVSAQARFLF